MGLYLSKKASIMLMMSSEQEKHLLIQSNFFSPKQYLTVLNVFAKFEYDQIKDEEAATILIETVFAIFDTQQSKGDVIYVIVTSLWI